MLKIKKWLSAFLVVTMCLSILPVNLFVIVAEAAQNVNDAEINEYSYGAQLTEQQKEVYLALKDAYIGKDGLSNGVTSVMTFTPAGTFAGATDDEIGQSIMKASTVFLADHPQLFWAGAIEVGTRCYEGTSYTLANATIEFKEKYSDAATTETIATYNAGVKAAVEEIFSSVTENYSTYDYYKAIHDWVCDKAEYNYDAADSVESDTYKSAFSSGPMFAGDGKVVCEGYGEAFKVLCDQLREQKGVYGSKDLQCVRVTGTGVTEDGAESHLWNHVLMPDGNWYAVDVTWDDQADIRYTYFLCGTDSVCFSEKTFQEDHIEDSTLTYYDIAENGYDGTIYRNVTLDYNNGELGNAISSFAIRRFGYFIFPSNSDYITSDQYLAGWYFDQAFTGSKISEPQCIDTDKTYYARLLPIDQAPTYTVTFESNGGSAVDSIQNAVEGKCISSPENPTKDGYVFGGWYKDRECTQKWYFSNDVITDNTILYARWRDISEYLRVTFVAEGSEDQVVKVWKGDSLSEADIPGVPEKEGYVGIWDNTELANVFVAIEDNITVHAVYVLKVTEGTPIESGTCGENLAWVFYDNGALNISGEGAMPAYTSASEAPWYTYRDQITSIAIEDGITSLPEGIFAGYNNLLELTIPFVGLNRDAQAEQALLGVLFGKSSNGGVFQPSEKDETSLYGYSYSIPSSLQKIVVTDANKISLGAFYNCSSLKEIVLNEEIKAMADFSLTGCSSLESLTIPFIGATAESSNTVDAVLGHIFGTGNATWVPQYFSLEESGRYYQIPDSLKEVRVLNDADIPFGAFSGCANLEKVILDFGTETVGAYAFYNATGLVSVEFIGDAVAIANDAFVGCGEIVGYIPSGNTTWTDDIISKNYGAQSIDWQRKINSVDQLADVNGVRLSLHDKIGIKFLVEVKENISGNDYMLVTLEGGEPYKIPVSEAGKEVSSLTGTEKYVFECNVNAKQMTKNVTVQMVVDGQKGTPVVYSVLKYAEAILAMEAGIYENEKAMVRAMLNYGGYAQVYFDQATSGLAKEGLYTDENDPVTSMETAVLNTYAPTLNQEEDTRGLHLSTVTLLLETETELRIYFALDEGKTLEDYSFDIVEKGKKLEIGYSEDKGKYYVAIIGIKATELENMYHITITEKESNEQILSLEYGAWSYARYVVNNEENVDLQNVVKALYLYGKEALTYNNSLQ